MIYENFKNLTTDRTIKAVIRNEPEEFDLLVLHFSVAYQEIQEERYKNKEIKRLPTGDRTRAFSGPEKQLFFVLFYLKTYSTFDVLGFHFGLSAGHAHDHTEFLMRILERALVNLNKLPKITVETPEELSQLIDKYNDMIIDSVEMPCVRPKDKEHQKGNYSGVLPFLKPEMGSVRFRVQKSGDGHGLRQPTFVLRPSRRALRAALGLPQGLDAVSHGLAFRLRRRSRAALR